MAIEPPYIGPADQDMYNARPMVDGRKVLCNGTVVKWDGPVHEVFAPIYKEAGSTEKVLIGTLADLGEAECLKALDAAVASWKSGRGEWAQVTLLRSFLSFSLLIEIDAPHLPRPSVRPSVRPPARPSVRPPAHAPLAPPLRRAHLRIGRRRSPRATSAASSACCALRYRGLRRCRDPRVHGSPCGGAEQLLPSGTKHGAAPARSLL
jgi:hypothetical protein